MPVPSISDITKLLADIVLRSKDVERTLELDIFRQTKSTSECDSFRTRKQISFGTNPHPHQRPAFRIAGLSQSVTIGCQEHDLQNGFMTTIFGRAISLRFNRIESHLLIHPDSVKKLPKRLRSFKNRNSITSVHRRLVPTSHQSPTHGGKKSTG